MKYEYDILEVGQSVFILANFSVLKGFISYVRFESIQKFDEFEKRVNTYYDQKYSVKIDRSGDYFMDLERKYIFTSRKSLIEYVERATE